MPFSLDDLQSRRQELLQQIGQVGDMRQGTITEVYRACGKPNCRCANPGDPGHGPYYAFTRKVGGKTKTLQLRAGPSLFKLEGQVEAYRRFRGLCTERVKVNESIRPSVGRTSERARCLFGAQRARLAPDDPSREWAK